MPVEWINDSLLLALFFLFQLLIISMLFSILSVYDVLTVVVYPESGILKGWPYKLK